MKSIKANWKWISLGALVLVLVGVAAFRWAGEKPVSSGAKSCATGAAVYRCPMHPAITSDKPDQCPICHMDLQKVDAEDLGDDCKDVEKPEKASDEKTAKKALYVCPMHPAVVSDKPGQCPVCHMDLQKVDDDEEMGADDHSEHAHNSAKPKSGKTLYHCPMHPNVVTEQPGDCPICHMKLQKVEDESNEEVAAEGHGQGVHGRAGFSLSLEKQQLIGVATAKVEKIQLESQIRATGSVAFDPDLFTAVEEYRQAIATKQEMASSPYASLRDQANEIVTSSETRLKLLGLNSAQIHQLSAGKGNALSLLLPNGSAWVYAEVFEYEVGGIKAGQEIEVDSPSAPGKRFSGKISSISPVVSGPTRTIRVRAQVPDPEGILRPDTFLNVKIKVKLGQTLAVPEDAVLHSGGGAFVFLVKGKGRFEPRPVVLGRRASEHYEVVSGLQEGDAVVAAANFLIDSESRLRSALQTMQSGGSDSSGEKKPAGAHSGH